MAKTLMVYGANGYTGELIAREAARRGLSLVIAGRSEVKLRPLAEELNCPLRCFNLEREDAVVEQLEGIDVLIHAAGPFSATAAPMMAACLKAGTHYTDITGEVEVFEHAQTLAPEAKRAGVALCSGVGFDVIPTDCVAAALVEALPDATHLALGFDTRSGLSPGTAKTSIEGMAKGCLVREGGQLRSIPLGFRSRRIDFGMGEKDAVTIPWGDVSTAYTTTGIPNIEVYIPMPRKMIMGMKWTNLLRPVLGLKMVQRMLKKRVEKSVKGPDEATRAKLPTYVWGEARNAAGKVVTARIKTANGYSLTIDGSLTVAEYLLDNRVDGGAYTPALLVGKSLIEQLPGSEKLVLS
ncbi:MAG: saccharopine dehydrogenase family protein [Pseudomonadota bacterium]